MGWLLNPYPNTPQKPFLKVREGCHTRYTALRKTTLGNHPNCWALFRQTPKLSENWWARLGALEGVDKALGLYVWHPWAIVTLPDGSVTPIWNPASYLWQGKEVWNGLPTYFFHFHFPLPLIPVRRKMLYQPQGFAPSSICHGMVGLRILWLYSHALKWAAHIIIITCINLYGCTCWDEDAGGAVD